MALLVKPNATPNGITIDGPSLAANWDTLYSFLNANITAVNANLGVWLFTANADATVPLSLQANSATQTGPLVRLQSLTTGATQPSGLIALQWRNGASAAADVTLQATSDGHLKLAGASGVSNSQTLQTDGTGQIITQTSPISYWAKSENNTVSILVGGGLTSNTGAVTLTLPASGSPTGWLIDVSLRVQTAGGANSSTCIGIGYSNGNTLSLSALAQNEQDFSVITNGGASSHSVSLTLANLVSDLLVSNVYAGVHECRYRVTGGNTGGTITFNGQFFNGTAGNLYWTWSMSAIARPY